MDYSSGEEFEFIDSEIAEYKDEPFQQLRDGALKVNYPNELADEAETPLKVVAPVSAAPISEEEDLFCWPWTGIVVNMVKESDNGVDFKNTEYWMKRFLKFKPEAVVLLANDNKQPAQALVRFKNDWTGFMNAMEFEKSFEAANHSKKEWSVSENSKGSSIYAWVARANDFESQGPIGEYLRTNRELKTIAGIVQEAVMDRNKAVLELESEIDMRIGNLDDLQTKYDQKTMSLSRMMEEKDNFHQAFLEEKRKMQRLAQDHMKRVLDEQEMLNAELEKRRKKLDSWSKELTKRDALTEPEKQILDEEKQKNDMQNSSLHKASIEQKNADESVLRLVEEQKREKEEALKKVLELERQLDAKQKLEMEIEELKGKLQVMKHLGDEDDTAVQEQIKKMNDELEAKIEEMDGVEEMYQTLVVKERQSNDELQEALKELIKNYMQNSSLHKASIELKKADESVLRLVEEQKRVKEEALKKDLKLEGQLDARQKLEMEIEELKGKLQVMKHLDDEDDTAVQEQIKKMNDELEAKMEEMDGVQEMIQTPAVKERQSNDEMQEARKELIKLEEALKKVGELEREKEEALKKVVELEREKEEALKKVVELERQVDDKRKLEMEVEELKGVLQVMELLVDEHDTAV
ncbi:hypothetical protein SSX86_015449 [Deinandra increscens subsp. villosa]|uniref:XS domain-containing protein n=1 Tax=Deinandra increscens subsp. villosa TaxID=3103831 RepID=A0AAP0D558_9ASTR